MRRSSLDIDQTYPGQRCAWHEPFVCEDCSTVASLCRKSVPFRQGKDKLKSQSDILLCSNLDALCEPNVSDATFFTTASDLVLANDICYKIQIRLRLVIIVLN